MRRFASVALIAVFAALMPAAAAQAAPGWTLTLSNVSVQPGGAARGMHVQYRFPDQTPPGELVFDLTALNAIATVTPPSGITRCTAAATTLTCDGTSDAFDLSVAANPGTPLGASALVTVRAVVEGTTRATATGRVTIAEQVALTAVDTQGDVSLPTGTSTDVTAAVRNTGDSPVRGVVLEWRAVRGITSTPHRNCAPTERGAACLFETELAPGATYRLATPWRITASRAVWAPSQWSSSFIWHTAQDWIDPGRALPSGSGPELELTPATSTLADPQTEIDVRDNADGWDLAVTGVNQSNFTAIGDTARAKVGKTVPVRLGMRNNGPAGIEGWDRAQGSYLVITFTPPSGTTVVGRSPLCRSFPTLPFPGPYPPDGHPDDGKLYCFTSELDGVPYLPYRTVNFDFILRVDQPGTLRGSINVSRQGPPPAGDPDPSDDTAAVIINPAGPTPTPGDGEGGGNGGGEGGGLPITGTNTTALALIGLALLLAGATARVATRRRPHPEN
ncbi:LPXTG cell wall anchor domain-containing protein [Actinoplanes sp. Pm04-4]|uniref:LPXTG cell wall anchor domain-containing protein n=1 Tax=Paractinoplanes pyxinae TaxID=2997416 RepID=A0ABT4AWU3_9ACTN|nr:LPXTG cell wall anchor domain-containing protein [Actinoplanes pyxinae]MCY1138342.1 LPXTG cell wall anchor domain-containing protein [Actinoplanes pyxinae]